METSLEPAGATAAAVPTTAGGSDPVTVYLARLTSAESRRAMATSLELLAELLVDGHPADRAERARRRRDGTPLAMAVPWHELLYGHTQALRSWLAEHCSPAAANRHLAALRGVLREAGASAAWVARTWPELSIWPVSRVRTSRPVAMWRTARSAVSLPPAWPTTPPPAAERPPS
jgi:hypothetical protein